MILCVTGPMASGKNAASACLEKNGFFCVDADKVVHSILKDEGVTQKIIQEFSLEAQKRGIVLKDTQGSLDRRALAKLIFSHKDFVLRQEAIVYPAFTQKIFSLLKEHKNKNVALNAAVLYKIPALMEAIDGIIYVDAPLILRLFRAKLRDGLSLHQIMQRFNSQKHLFAKYASFKADIVRVWNIGSRNYLRKKILKVLARFSQKGKFWE